MSYLSGACIGPASGVGSHSRSRTLNMLHGTTFNTERWGTFSCVHLAQLIYYLRCRAVRVSEGIGVVGRRLMLA